MPSLKMKTLSTTGCLKEKYGLHVCQKSTMISKNPLSRARVAQNAEIGIYTQNCQDAALHNEVYAQDLGGDKGNHDKLSNESKLFQKQESTLTDSATAVSVGSTPLTGTSKIETIFSPILETIGFQHNEGSDNLYMPRLDSEDSDDGSRSSCGYQECNMSDFYISDMNFSGPATGRHSAVGNKADTTFLPDYKCEQPSLLCDLKEDYVVSPFLEDNMGIGYDHDGGVTEETTIDGGSSSLHMAIHQLGSYNQDSHIDTYPEPDCESFDPQIYIRNPLDQPDMAYSLMPTSMPSGKQNMKPITLVLDLDETLVHSTLDHCDDADFTFPVSLDKKEHAVYVKQRPHLQTFLKRVAEMFEIVVFTASQSIYAKQLLDILDPEGKLISRRAYRESCIYADGNYIKDLTVLNVDLAKVVIIDNTPQVFRLQVNNGIPIKSWFDDPSDCALISLLPFLETLVDADDVRPIIARKFGHMKIHFVFADYGNDFRYAW
ncbi:TFIIF-interacting CTD phosphatase, including NLI-interacting factor [Handroanthus impetiginosus]|uniref:TFIIF-interacting CTD phosphatase, including NLI-interacting factor n=1 Tax=Handroanthus impetiginosus TaxID=429701 RepID=A0A2G9GHQ1_9LAMI|nr:TFIIF-interacting CTD phosphatase, including NLI-interacting factor [Handroanthus impetiginosus]